MIFSLSPADLKVFLSVVKPKLITLEFEQLTQLRWSAEEDSHPSLLILAHLLEDLVPVGPPGDGLEPSDQVPLGLGKRKKMFLLFVMILIILMIKIRKCFKKGWFSNLANI